MSIRVRFAAEWPWSKGCSGQPTLPATKSPLPDSGIHSRHKLAHRDVKCPAKSEYGHQVRAPLAAFNEPNCVDVKIRSFCQLELAPSLLLAVFSITRPKAIVGSLGVGKPSSYPIQCLEGYTQ